MTKSFFNDNARPHVARPVKEALERMRYDIPLPYSPDLAPSDDLFRIDLFRSMQHGLSEQHFTSYEDIKNWLDEWIAAKEQFFLIMGFIYCLRSGKIANDDKYFA